MSVVVRQLIESSGDLHLPKPDDPSSVFALPALLKMWQEQLGWTGVHITSGDSSLLGIVKATPAGKIFFSLPYGGYGGIASTGSRDGCSAIFDWLKAQRFLQENIVQFLPAAVEYPGTFYRDRLATHIIDLTQPSAYSENTERNLRKARSSDLQLVELDTTNKPAYLELLAEHQKRTRELRRLPAKCYEFLLDQSEEENSGISVFGVRSGSVLCAVHLYFHCRNDAFYFDGFSSALGLEVGANFLLLDESISRFRSEGIARLNLGATPPLDKGLERFKEGWGAVSTPYTEYSRRSQLKRMLDFMTRLR